MDISCHSNISSFFFIEIASIIKHAQGKFQWAPFPLFCFVLSYKIINIYQTHNAHHPNIYSSHNKKIIK
jgi:hypothetical protein